MLVLNIHDFLCFFVTSGKPRQTNVACGAGLFIIDENLWTTGCPVIDAHNYAPMAGPLSVLCVMLSDLSNDQ